MFFDSVRNNKRAVQIFLALITLPFAFWGIDSYVRNTGAGTDLASVGDTKITVQQYELAWRAQQDRMREALGASFTPEMMKTPAVRLAVLNSLIDQRVLLLEAAKGRLAASDGMLREVIGKIPALQEDGQFSMARYKAALAGQGMSQAQFEAQLRQDLTLQQIVAAVGETAIGSQAVTDTLQRIRSEERQVAESRIAPGQFAAQVKLDEQAARKFYDDNPQRFAIAEQARVEYLVLSLDALLARTKPTESEIRAWYDGHPDRYRQAEERRASHILIATGGDGDQAKAKAKAEEILGEVRKSPARFAELARQHSQDTGSAEKGGDLGFFARGMMVKPFEEAVFNLRENEISPLVQSDFGYHIIRLTEIKPGKQRSLAEARAEIEDELRRQSASRQFAEAAESFSNVVYEQPDSLQPAAEKFDLRVQQSAWLPRNPTPDALRALGQLGNAKLLNSVFSEDSVKNRRNTEVVEIAPNTLIAARVVEHRPASVRAFESVREDIEKGLRLREQAALARAAGEAKLAELRQGAADTLPWTPAKKVSRQDPGQLSPAAIKAIFRTEASKLPAYTGAEAGDGSYSLFKVVGVRHPATTDENQRRALQRQYDTILGQEDFAAYLASLRQRHKIDINTALLESKER